MKKIWILLLLLTGCSEEPILKQINSYEINFNEEVYLYDLIEQTNLETENILLDTNSLKEYNIELKYQDKIENITIKVVDKEAPLIFGASKFNLKLNQSFDLLKSIGYGDNYDRSIEINIKGTYDLTQIGTYNITVQAIDSSNNQTNKDITINVLEEISYGQSTPIYLEDLIQEHKTENTEIGIDVSTWQDEIDWNKVKASGVEFAIIRLGFGYNINGQNVLDNRYIENIKGAIEAGIDVGVYFFSYASTIEEIDSQVNYILEILDGIELQLPIVFDWEDWEDFEEYNLNFTDLNNLANHFLSKIEQSGYQAMLYGSAFYLERVWDLDYLTWVAHYTEQTDYEKEYYIWQLTDQGIVEGIDGNVDLNILYK